MNTPSALLRSALCAWVSLIVSISSLPVTAQRGVPSHGRDFYVGFLPPQLSNRGGSAYFAFIGSFTNNNFVTISYFDKDGKEFDGPRIKLDSLQVKAVAVDRLSLTPEYPGEKPEFKAAHIRSTMPITVQLYHEGFAAAGMLLALPTEGLGMQYSVAAYNDRMRDDITQFNVDPLQRDSSSGEFLIIATEDNTGITITTNSTTIKGQVGKNYGPGSDRQTSHPKSIGLQRGQTYWVRSLPGAEEWDISSTMITSNKPIAVYGGHEKTFINNPYPDPWGGNDNECRDYIVEQMIPAEAWERSGYHSIPFSDPLTTTTRLLKNSHGDLYRVFTLDPNGAAVTALQYKMGSPYVFTIPQMFWDEYRLRNIEYGIDIASEDDRKIYVVMYDYFQGENYVHGQPEDGAKGDNDILGGGGPKPLDSRNYIEPKEMNVIPYPRWTKSALFKVPQSSNYRGGQYINVITKLSAADKLTHIKVIQDRGNAKALNKLGAIIHTYVIPNRPDLRGYQFRGASGSDYFIYSDSIPFIAYQHGTSSADKQNWGGYGAPTNGYVGTKTEAHIPKIRITPFCSEWIVTITDSLPNDMGIADVYLLNDPQGYLYQPPQISYNMQLDPSEPQFKRGDPRLSFTVRVIDARKPAHGSLYVLDRSGNDTVYTFDYFPPKFELSPRAASMEKTLNCTDSCAVFTFKNTNEPGAKPIIIEDIKLLAGTEGFTITSITPSLPVSLDRDQTTTIRICYRPKDTNTIHTDLLVVETDCLTDTVEVRGSGITPLILAGDADFGPVLVGETKCLPVRIFNPGDSPLELTKDWLLHYTAEFSFPDATKLPLWIQPGAFVTLEFCYSPQQVGPDSTTNDWGTNLCAPYEHQIKDYSILKGAGVTPGILWDRLTQTQAVVCEEIDTVRVILLNNQTATERVVRVRFEGPNATEFAIIANQFNYNPLEGFDMAPGDSIWVDVTFKPILANGYGDRSARLVAYGRSGSTPTIDFTGKVTYAGLVVDKTNFDFGEIPQNQTTSLPATLSNDGTADLVIETITISNPEFTVTGIAIGDIIPPGGSKAFTVDVSTAQSLATTTINITGKTSCPPPVIMTAQAMTGRVGVAISGANYPATWIECRENVNKVYATNTGTKPVTLKQVSIVADPFHPNFDQFEFTAGGVRTVSPNAVIVPGDTLWFDIYFRPTMTGALSALVQYSFDSSASGTGMPFERNDFLFATGKLLRDTLTALGPGGDPYTAKTNEFFVVPVRLVEPILPADAEIYGYQFKLTWKRDLFQLDETKITEPPGYSLAYTKEYIPGSSDESVIIKCTTTAPITDLMELASVGFQLMIARDTLSDFIVSDGVFLGSDGLPLCYAYAGHIPGSFVPQDLCGDKTVRDFLRNKVPVDIIAISPNPVSGRGEVVLLSHLAEQPVTVELYDMLGMKQMTIASSRLLSIGTHRLEFSTEGLASGAYSVRVSAPTQVLSRTLLIRR